MAAYLTSVDVVRMFSKAPHPSFNTPRKPQPIGVALANTPSGDIAQFDCVVSSAGLGPNASQAKLAAYAASTIRAGDLCYVTADGRITSTPPGGNSKRKEGNVPKYTSVTTRPSGFVFRVTTKIPHPTLDKLVMIPIEGDLFTVERDDEWKIGDLAMYIAPGEHFCGEVNGADVYPACAFLFGDNRGACLTVLTKTFAGVPSRGFLTKPPKDYPQTASPEGVFAYWESEQREAARAAKAAATEATKKAEEATKKLGAEFEAFREAAIATIADALGKDARQRYIDRANGKPGGGSIRLVALRSGGMQLQVFSNRAWRTLDHIKVMPMISWYSGEESQEIARW